MLDDPGASELADRLAAAATHERLSQAARDQARGLADRLAQGVKICLLGPKGAGKSAICDAIVGRRSEIRAQEVTRIFSTHPAGVQSSFGPGRSITLPLTPAVLGGVQLVDVALPQDPAAWPRAMARMVEVADIVLWCTEGFAPPEATLWAQVPDALKDHSFLVLTKADLLARQGLLEARITGLQAVVTEEFHSLFPTTTPRLMSRIDAGTGVSETDLAASGVKALIEAVANLVASGHRADMDSAMLFLQRHGEALAAAPASADLASVAADPAARRPYATARDKIMERALDLAEMSFDASPADLSEVLELCGTISEDLVDVMQQQAGDFADLAPWCAVCEDASDKIMLMTMENDTRSAADAVSILLQLRRDFEYLAVH
ncbi:P-loop NTPase family protein [Roseobacter weihaiensis]|uniref:hypothetical protein n=1 Tax=Roseobacter weihaiensis TaxID=2763262 RepID=UPI001D0A494F|nr:hypothetical protein [Roseobacter sp. H9]